ncbi:hypothetical protein GUJ93_ZPchr0014g47364 [Zizania palustris]|uniref:Uncharacterized protein n=1 Tax=Zizania palustris TaxID=103762 RepID=A0A8J5VSE7_ZIZPA|nr:hypothetical protein GUJ93_ZPchr0014g47364 [Zizania palustris]
MEAARETQRMRMEMALRHLDSQRKLMEALVDRIVDSLDGELEITRNMPMSSGLPPAVTRPSRHPFRDGLLKKPPLAHFLSAGSPIDSSIRSCNDHNAISSSVVYLFSEHQICD